MIDKMGDDVVQYDDTVTFLYLATLGGVFNPGSGKKKKGATGGV